MYKEASEDKTFLQSYIPPQRLITTRLSHRRNDSFHQQEENEEMSSRRSGKILPQSRKERGGQNLKKKTKGKIQVTTPTFKQSRSKKPHLTASNLHSQRRTAMSSMSTANLTATDAAITRSKLGESNGNIREPLSSTMLKQRDFQESRLDSRANTQEQSMLQRGSSMAIISASWAADPQENSVERKKQPRQPSRGSALFGAYQIGSPRVNAPADRKNIMDTGMTSQSQLVRLSEESSPNCSSPLDYDHQEYAFDETMPFNQQLGTREGQGLLKVAEEAMVEAGNYPDLRPSPGDAGEPEDGVGADDSYANDISVQSSVLVAERYVKENIDDVGGDYSEELDGEKQDSIIVRSFEETEQPASKNSGSVFSLQWIGQQPVANTLDLREQALQDELKGLDSKIKTRLIEKGSKQYASSLLKNEAISKAMKISDSRKSQVSQLPSSKERGAMFKSLNKILKPSATFIEPSKKKDKDGHATPSKATAQVVVDSEPSLLGSSPIVSVRKMNSKHLTRDGKSDHLAQSMLKTSLATPSERSLVSSMKKKKKKYNFSTAFGTSQKNDQAGEPDVHLTDKREEINQADFESSDQQSRKFEQSRPFYQKKSSQKKQHDRFVNSLGSDFEDMPYTLEDRQTPTLPEAANLNSPYSSKKKISSHFGSGSKEQLIKSSSSLTAGFPKELTRQASSNETGPEGSKCEESRNAAQKFRITGTSYQTQFRMSKSYHKRGPSVSEVHAAADSREEAEKTSAQVIRDKDGEAEVSWSRQALDLPEAPPRRARNSVAGSAPQQQEPEPLVDSKPVPISSKNKKKSLLHAATEAPKVTAPKASVGKAAPPNKAIVPAQAVATKKTTAAGEKQKLRAVVRVIPKERQEPQACEDSNRGVSSSVAEQRPQLQKKPMDREPIEPQSKPATSKNQSKRRTHHRRRTLGSNVVEILDQGSIHLKDSEKEDDSLMAESNHFRAIRHEIAAAEAVSYSQYSFRSSSDDDRALLEELKKFKQDRASYTYKASKQQMQKKQKRLLKKKSMLFADKNRPGLRLQELITRAPGPATTRAVAPPVASTEPLLSSAAIEPRIRSSRKKEEECLTVVRPASKRRLSQEPFSSSRGRASLSRLVGNTLTTKRHSDSHRLRFEFGKQHIFNESNALLSRKKESNSEKRQDFRKYVRALKYDVPSFPKVHRLSQSRRKDLRDDSSSNSVQITSTHLPSRRLWRDMVHTEDDQVYAGAASRTLEIQLQDTNCENIQYITTIDRDENTILKVYRVKVNDFDHGQWQPPRNAYSLNSPTRSEFACHHLSPLRKRRKNEDSQNKRIYLSNRKHRNHLDLELGTICGENCCRMDDPFDAMLKPNNEPAKGDFEDHIITCHPDEVQPMRQAGPPAAPSGYRVQPCGQGASKEVYIQLPNLASPQSFAIEDAPQDIRYLQSLNEVELLKQNAFDKRYLKDTNPLKVIEDVVILEVKKDARLDPSLEVPLDQYIDNPKTSGRVRVPVGAPIAALSNPVQVQKKKRNSSLHFPAMNQKSNNFFKYLGKREGLQKKRRGHGDQEDEDVNLVEVLNKKSPARFSSPKYINVKDPTYKSPGNDSFTNTSVMQTPKGKEAEDLLKTKQSSAKIEQLLSDVVQHQGTTFEKSPRCPPCFNEQSETKRKRFDLRTMAGQELRSEAKVENQEKQRKTRKQRQAKRLPEVVCPKHEDLQIEPDFFYLRQLREPMKFPNCEVFAPRVSNITFDKIAVPPKRQDDDNTSIRYNRMNFSIDDLGCESKGFGAGIRKPANERSRRFMAHHPEIDVLDPLPIIADQQIRRRQVIRSTATLLLEELETLEEMIDKYAQLLSYDTQIDPGHPRHQKLLRKVKALFQKKQDLEFKDWMKEKLANTKQTKRGWFVAPSSKDLPPLKRVSSFFRKHAAILGCSTADIDAAEKLRTSRNILQLGSRLNHREQQPRGSFDCGSRSSFRAKTGVQRGRHFEKSAEKSNGRNSVSSHRGCFGLRRNLAKDQADGEQQKHLLMFVLNPK